jgi:hypothetical protein
VVYIEREEYQHSTFWFRNQVLFSNKVVERGSQQPPGMRRSVVWILIALHWYRSYDPPLSLKIFFVLLNHKCKKRENGGTGHWTGWRSGNVLYSYSKGDRFESQPGHRLYWVGVFISSFRKMPISNCFPHYCNGFDQGFARQPLCKHVPTNSHPSTEFNFVPYPSKINN